jgi:hypothetical protein
VSHEDPRDDSALTLALCAISGAGDPRDVRAVLPRRALRRSLSKKMRSPSTGPAELATGTIIKPLTEDGPRYRLRLAWRQGDGSPGVIAARESIGALAASPM